MLIFDCSGYFHCKHFYGVNTPMRTVPVYELEIIIRGNGFSHINGALYPHLPGRLLLAKPGDRRFTIGNFEALYIKFICDDEETEAMLRSLPSTALTKNSTLRQMLQKWTPVPGSSPAAIFARQAALYQVLAEAASVLTNSHEQLPNTPHLSSVLAAKEYLDTHYSEKITLETLADTVHMSRNFFRAKFSESLGLSPREYLLQVRLAHVREMLRQTDLPLSEIALACGFDSQAYMTFVFKRENNTTPLVYRKDNL